MNSRRVFLHTYGCQMNERDSEEILGMLQGKGYALATQPEAADILLINTCAVREHAEERAISQMGRFQELKQQRPEMILGLLGCVAKVQREAIFRRLPQVDLVCGPAELYDLPDLLADVQERRQKILAINRACRPLDKKPAGDYRSRGVTAFVTIMEGCDKRCTYCIVPRTRGLEISRPAEDVLAEVRGLTAAGYREVTLLGQNVNSYGKRLPTGDGYRGPVGRQRRTPADRWTDFPALLRRLDAETAVSRIRFTTSHPFDAHEDLFRAMSECPSVCEFLHLPVQSGSNRILHLMHRGYTVESYLSNIQRVRELLPQVALSTDVIVGFPGETDDDFEATVRLMERVEYDSAFLFKYSPRPGTPACELPDDVPLAVKATRHQRLLTMQQAITRCKQDAWIGRTAEVLVENTLEGHRLFGRTRMNRAVIFEGPATLVGQLVPVTMHAATLQTLTGALAA